MCTFLYKKKTKMTVNTHSAFVNLDLTGVIQVNAQLPLSYTEKSA